MLNLTFTNTGDTHPADKVGYEPPNQSSTSYKVGQLQVWSMVFLVGMVAPHDPVMLDHFSIETHGDLGMHHFKNPPYIELVNGVYEPTKIPGGHPLCTWV